MAKRRLLPEAAYDFWCRDSRDGEVTPRVDTMAEARVELRERRSRVRRWWMRSAWQIQWGVNERKVLVLLQACADGGKK